MQTRTATLLSRTDLGEAGTKVIEINLKDIISRIKVKFRAINGAAHISAHPAANITKLELVDGSDVLFSLSGHQAQALNFFDRGKIPFSGIYTYNGAGCSVNLGIDFGRFLYDRALAFDPKKFDNPQLKITWDEDICQTDCSENYCTVLADIFEDDPPTPSGFFVAKEIYSYVAATSGYHYVDLPVDLITNQIFVKALLASYDFAGEIDELRLSEDNDRRVPLDLTSYLIQEKLFEEYGFVEEHAKLEPSDTVQNFYGMPSGESHAMGSCEGAEEEVSIWSNGGGLFGYEGAAGTYRPRAKLIGMLPHGTVALLPKPGPEIANWYKTNELGSLQLRIKDSANAADVLTVEVMVKQYRPYA